MNHSVLHFRLVDIAKFRVANKKGDAFGMLVFPLLYFPEKTDEIRFQFQEKLLDIKFTNFPFFEFAPRRKQTLQRGDAVINSLFIINIIMLMYHIPSIIQKTYKFYLLLYSCTKTFPKKDRFTLGQKSENLTLEILEILYLANSKRDQEKIPYLREVDLKLKIAQTVVRIAHDVNALEDKKYYALSASLEELGRMLGGWIRSLTTEKESPAQ